MRRAVDILYEDDYLLVVNKPPGLLSIPDRFDSEKPSLFQQLQEWYGEVFIVHRLDRETSGIICFARTAEAHRALSLQFEQRTVQKIYLALVDGIPQPADGVIEEGIAPHPTIAGKMVVSNRGKAAITFYKVLETFRTCSLVEADIRTGRTHQIRVHFAAIGHPLLVDPLYGRRAAFFLSEIKGRRFNLGRDQEERPLIDRTSLHASRLKLLHPHSGEQENFEAPLPKDLQACLNQLRKWGG